MFSAISEAPGEEALMLGKALSSTFSVGVMSRLVAQICALIQIIVASNYFGLAEFGAYALAWACTIIFKTFNYTGYYHALLRTKTPDEDSPTIFGVMVVIGLLWAVFAVTAAQVFGNNQPLLRHMFLALAAYPLIDALVAWSEVRLIRQGRIRTTSTITSGAEIVTTLALIAALGVGLGPIALVIARYAGLFFQAILFVLCLRQLPGLALRSAILHKHWHTAFPLWVSTGTGMLTNYGADLVLGAFLNPAQVGAYRGGARIATTAVDLVQQPLGILNWSRFSRLYNEGQQDALPDAWRSNMGFAGAVVWPLLIAVALTSHQIVLVLFDETWLPAAPVVAILCLVNAIRLISSQLEPILTSYDRQYLQLRIRLFGLGLLIAGLLAAGRYGAEAAAQVQIFTASVMCVISVFAIANTMQRSALGLLSAFLPALGLTALSGAVVVLTAPLIAGMSDLGGLAVTVVLTISAWAVALALVLSTGKLQWPQA